MRKIDQVYQFDEANRHLEIAEQEFVKGHRSQTELIRESENGVVPNFLMIHAQDHVMTAQAELKLIKKLILNYKLIHDLEKRIEVLDGK
ncbi:PTS lactose/cellobiose transporter subunit IIA [Terrilactibacillus laevilacticus]|uniref:PTS lactose/cellobiose transporter subunit IIA n=1 Tax=Terrilactibacillus laevilacticus TaxID=1380157 RepID=A0ABW5PSA2_9BACI|nr:PTS lactose/cellobiose transporter subunit IIA [Terrilactibacillus laevilacticus]